MTLDRQQLVGVGLALMLHLSLAAWWMTGRAMTPPKAPLQAMTFSLQSAEEPAPPTPAPPVRQPTPPTPRQQVAPTPRRVEAPRPTPVATLAPAPASDAQSVAPPPAAAAPAATGTPTEQPAITPPRFDAAYLANPAPPYPGLSRRMNEQGRVLLRVKVSAEGLPLEVEVSRSSGFPRLDAAAREAVLGWKFVPARQGDRPVVAAVNVPIAFKLD